MTKTGYSWLTFHRARFSRALGAGDKGTSPPSSGGVWRVGPNAAIAANGFNTEVDEVWAGVGFHATRKAAEAAMAGDGPPFGNDAEEAWHGLLGVIAHRGEVDWSTKDQPHPALAPLKDDPGGVLAVITSAGYTSRDPSQYDRMRDFISKVQKVQAFYAGLEANVARQVFTPPDSSDGISFSVWRSDAGMMRAAYKDGAHRQYMDQHKAEAMFDRSSFTRLRLLASRGTWDGADPLAEAA